MKLTEIDQSSQKAWTEALRQHRLLYPDERVVGFLARRFPAAAGNGQRHAIDIGAGSGRHMKLMMDYGFQTWGVDYAQEAVQTALVNFAPHPLLREVVWGDFRSHRFPVRFDVVVAWGVPFLTRRSEILPNLQGMAALLSEEGRIFLNFRTRENSLFGQGEEIEPGCFVLDERSGAYQGMCYTFMDLPEVEALVEQAGLQIVHLEKLVYHKNNLSELHSWLLTELVRKP